MDDDVMTFTQKLDQAIAAASLAANATGHHYQVIISFTPSGYRLIDVQQVDDRLLEAAMAIVDAEIA